MKTKTNIGLVLTGWRACLQLLAAAPPPSANAIFQAIRAGDLTAVKTLLESGADLRARDESGDTPLMAAALNAEATVLELLLKAGADVNATNQAGATALLRAATLEEKTRLLVAKGADVKVSSQTGNNALILAARQAGNSRTVKFLLDQGVDPNVMNLFGATALMSAAAAGDLESVRLLLDRGANVNLRPDPGTKEFFWGGLRTPLMWAAFQGDEALLKLMLERGAKVNDLVELGGALGQAAWGGHAGVAGLLLDAGAQVDQRDLIANYTPLHWAASSEKSSPAVVELLLARGADASAEGGQNVDNYLGVAQTPLMLARLRGDTLIVRALLKAGAKDLSGPKTGPKTPALASTAAKTAAEAVQRALPSLTRTAEDSVSTFLRHGTRQDCVSCHQQSVPLAALSLAHARHFATDRVASRHQVELMKRSFMTGHIQNQHSLHEVNLQATFHPDPGILAGYTAMNYELEREPASALTDGMLHQLTTMQHADGHWAWNLPRVPIQASDLAATASAVHAIKTFGIPAQRQELAARVQRALTWLRQAPAETSDERVHQLLGLSWAGESTGALKPFVEAVQREQRADGGWGQLAGLDSDAYATGQSLYALMEGGKVSASDPEVKRGIDFLLRTQLADGTWHVRTRAHPFQPPMDSGFPHGRDGWISAAATGWSVMALALATDPATIPTLTPPIADVPKQTPGSAKAPSSDGPVEFARDIQPLIERSCVDCHSGEKPKGGFAMSDRASLLKGGKRGEPVVVPGKPDAGQLLHLVQDQVEDLEMPPVAKRGKYPAISKDEAERVRAWIEQGAVWPEGVSLRASGERQP
ncbi:MAG: ankyrin repeat domain-containing protein [Verrucomicrobiota bacterium]